MQRSYFCIKVRGKSIGIKSCSSEGRPSASSVFITYWNVCCNEERRQMRCVSSYTVFYGKTIFGSSYLSRTLSRVWTKCYEWKSCPWMVYLFKNWRENINDQKNSDRPSLVTNELVQKVDERVREYWQFTIFGAVYWISRDFQDRLVRNSYGEVRKFCARWMFKILTEHSITERIVSAVDFLLRYDKEEEPFLNRILTDDETWDKGAINIVGSFKFAQQTKKWSSRFVCQKTDGNGVLGCQRGVVGWIYGKGNNHK